MRGGITVRLYDRVILLFSLPRSLSFGLSYPILGCQLAVRGHSYDNSPEEGIVMMFRLKRVYL